MKQLFITDIEHYLTLQLFKGKIKHPALNGYTSKTPPKLRLKDHCRREGGKIV